MWLIVPLAFIIVALYTFSLTRYKKCPPDKILVIYGKVGVNPDGSAKSCVCINGGGAFIVPFIQSYVYLDVVPLNLSIETSRVLTKERNYIDFSANFTVQISVDKDIMPNAAERLLGLSSERITGLASQAMVAIVNNFVNITDEEEILDESYKFFEKFIVFADSELNKLGLKIIASSIKEINFRQKA